MPVFHRPAHLIGARHPAVALVLGRPQVQRVLVQRARQLPRQRGQLLLHLSVRQLPAGRICERGDQLFKTRPGPPERLPPTALPIRFEAAAPGELWVSDVLHGPAAGPAPG
jgi:hypothetical protein